MKIGILGTGMVGSALATKLVELDHDVCMGSRSATNETAKEWLGSVGGHGSIGTFADAAAHGDVLFNCTKGEAALDVLHSCGEHLADKVLVDVTNPLDFSHGMPPTLSIINDDSLGETIQRTFPRAKVVKALNTINASIMVNPAQLTEPTDLFICGNDADAKRTVTDLLGGFGWSNDHVIDLGDITNARGTEQYLALWVRLWGALETPAFNVRVVR